MITEKILLVLYWFGTHILLFAFRSFLLWRDTGINPVVFEKKDDAHDFNGQVFRFVFVLSFFTIALYAFGGKWYEYLLPIWYLEAPYLKIIGWALMIIPIPFVFLAQLQMSDSWRIGIDKKNETDLIETGLFRWSRNPIYLGIFVAHLGFFLVLPNALTLLYVVLSFVTVQVQVRLEEAFLKEIHGSEFLAYCERVRRWI